MVLDVLEFGVGKGVYMKYAIIENNVVVNVALADFPMADNWVQSDAAVIGDGYINGVIVKPPILQTVPQVVFMRQARLALLEVNLLDNVDQIISLLPEPMQSEAKIEWEYATEVRRDWPTLNQIAQYLNLTSEYVDDLFILAGTK